MAKKPAKKATSKATKKLARKAASRTPKAPATARATTGSKPHREDDIVRCRIALAQQAARERAERKAAFRKQVQMDKKPGLGLTTTGKLYLLAEGDSWFHYPVPFAGGSLIDKLGSTLQGRARLLNLAHAGDEVREMMGVSQQERLIEALSDRSLGTFDAILFSGGGNDIVGDELALWLNPRRPGDTWRSALHTPRIENVFRVIRAGLEDLVSVRDRFASGAHILLNCYDFPNATGRGVCGQGPWLRPALVFRGWTDPQDQFQIVRDMLNRYREMLVDFASTTQRCHVVGTQGHLDPDRHWANELHPNSDGFEIASEQFRLKLAALFPGKV